MGGWGSVLVQGIVRAFSAGGLVLELVEKILGREGEGGDRDGDGDDEVQALSASLLNVFKMRYVSNVSLCVLPMLVEDKF